MRLDAIRITQPSGRDVYALATTVDMILQIATVPHMRRVNGELAGYQRPEVIGHINEIRRYLESQDSVLPNAIVVAFDDSVHFHPHRKQTAGAVGEYGSLDIPDPEPEQKPKGFVVDGQQRIAAIATSRLADFPVFVTAMIASSEAEQRKQFLLVNRSKPLPQGMVFEMLPEVDGMLPTALARQRLAARMTVHLNLWSESALYQRIKMPTCPGGYIKDNSVRRMLLNSLSDGALYAVAAKMPHEADLAESGSQLVSTFWTGVAEAFGDAWNLPPRRSRLTHGVGIIAMGFVMDYMSVLKPRTGYWTAEKVTDFLRPLREHCAWTEGVWRFPGTGERNWNDLQNIDRDIRLLAGHLQRVLCAC
jgi:DGQHR domain-containing protein